MSTIMVKASINAPVQKVWEYWTKPEHITKWSFASDDWESPYAKNDLKVGGKFMTGMAAKDGSSKFDFEGKYTMVKEYKGINYQMDDGRKVEIRFEDMGEVTLVTETFEPENIHPDEFQKGGWQAILNNFKKYVESNN
jgi:uncharacterized protein YndB with AHSA1/START domain